MKDNYTDVLELARREFARKNTMEISRFSGAAFSFYPPTSLREFFLPYLGRVYRVIWPTGEVMLYPSNKEAAASTAITLLHYLIKATGKPPLGKWLPFRHLWGGDSFSTAFIKRVQEPLAEFFGKREAIFKELLLERLHSRPAKEQNSYLTMALPRLPLLLRLETGDNQVPARVSVLFDETANEYLVTENLAGLGGILASRLLQWGKEKIQAQKS